jgi:hypothetical protein
MPKFLVENLSTRLVTVGIEPWADADELQPNERVEFEYTEPADVAFSVLDQNTVGVSIMSDSVGVCSVKGRRLYEMPPSFRLKPSA